METIKIDIQKLQLLNDRIAQTIDALNQVRMSMHSIQHSSSPFGYSPYSQFGQVSPFGQWGSPVGVGYGVSPYGSFVPQSYANPFNPFASGLQHTTSQVPGQVWGSPYGSISPYGNSISPYGSSFSPYASSVSPFGSSFSPFGTGLAHTTWDPTWMRAQQISPFAQTTWTPTTIY